MKNISGKIWIPILVIAIALFAFIGTIKAWHIVGAVATCKDGKQLITVSLSDAGPGSFTDGTVTGTFGAVKEFSYEASNPHTVTVTWNNGEHSTFTVPTKDCAVPPVTPPVTVPPTTVTPDQPKQPDNCPHKGGC